MTTRRGYLVSGAVLLASACGGARDPGGHAATTAVATGSASTQCGCYAEPCATSAAFTRADRDAATLGLGGKGPWYRLELRGTGFCARGMPVMISVGDQVCIAVLLYPDETGADCFVDAPVDGAAIAVGYGGAVATPLAFHP